jgi:hypothetical protein
MRKSYYPKFKPHVLRFGSNGKPLARFFKKPRRREKRNFPDAGFVSVDSYALAFYRANAEYVRFVGVDYGL